MCTKHLAAAQVTSKQDDSFAKVIHGSGLWEEGLQRLLPFTFQPLVSLCMCGSINSHHSADRWSD